MSSKRQAPLWPVTSSHQFIASLITDWHFLSFSLGMSIMDDWGGIKLNKLRPKAENEHFQCNITQYYTSFFVIQCP